MLEEQIEALRSDLKEKEGLHQEALKKIRSLEHQEAQRSNELEQARIDNNRELKNYQGALHGAYQKITSLEQANAGQSNRLEEVIHSLIKEQMERTSLSTNVNRLKVLFAAEQKSREEAETERDRFQSLLQEQMAKQMLGRGINIQGNLPTLPEVVETVRRTLTITVSTWLEDAVEVLAPSGIGDDHLLQFVLIQLCQLCVEVVESHREEVVSIFLGKVEGLTEQDMDDESSHFMRQHLRRHYQTLFPLENSARAKAARGVVSKIANELFRKTKGDPGLQVDHILRLLVGSGLEKIIDEYLHILVNCTLQNPPVTFTEDCGTVEKFESERHHLPIDGEMAESRCIIVFPGLIVGGEKAPNKPHADNRRYVLAVQDGTNAGVNQPTTCNSS